VRDLTDTIMTNGFHHHYPLVKGEYTGVLKELCYWLDLSLLDVKKYTDYNVPDWGYFV
jgi:hypothetical protein